MRRELSATLLAGLLAIISVGAAGWPVAAAAQAVKPVDETLLVPAKELSDYLLQNMIGIAAVSVGLGADEQEETPTIYTLDGDRLIPSGKIFLRGTRPISTYRVGTSPIVNLSRAVVRRYPALEHRGSYVRVALDPSGQRSEWLRLTPEGAFPGSVDFVDFGDASSFRCYQLDLFYFNGSGERKLFERPEKNAPSRPISSTPGKPGYVAGDIVPLQRKGNFFEIAAVAGMNDPKTPIGWVELKDPSGKLTIWFTPGPDC
ncbi:MAG TPA: hypothetical protein VHR45_08140 [Thermoanaerobaculia bacterium]|nr:hypothetical protein [Thermoanaerobaculia bacterium]